MSPRALASSCLIFLIMFFRFTASTAYPLASGSGVKNNLDFTARYISTLADVTAGKANSVATFTLNYN